MAREVELPDGRILDVPDDATPEQLASLKDKLRTKYADHLPKADTRQQELETQVAAEAQQAAAKKPGFMENMLRGITQGADDFGRGLTRLPGAAVQLGKDFGHGVERIATGDVSGKEAYEAFIETPARSVPGADFVAAGAGNIVNALEGDKINHNLVDENRARGEELRQKYPGSALATELASAGAVGARIAKIPALAVTEAGAAGNTLKTAAQGALASGAVELADSGDVGKAAGAAALGGVATPILSGGAKALVEGLGPTARAIANRVTGGAVDSGKVPPGMRKLAEVLKIKPAELEAKRLEIKQLTGRNASVAELADPDTINRLRPIAESQPSVEKAAIDAAKAGEIQRPTTLRNAVEKGGPTGSVNEIEDARKKLFDSTMNTHGGRMVELRAPDFLNKRSVIQTIRSIAENSPPDARRVLDEFSSAIQSGKKGSIRLRDLENVRVGLNDAIKAKPELTEVLRPVRLRLNQIAGNQIPEYGAALKQYGVLGDFAEGAKAGRAALKGSTTEFKAANDAANATTKKGQEIGLRTAMADDLGASFGRSTRAAEGLQAPDVAERVTTALGAPEAERLGKVAKLEAQAGRNLDRLDLSPGKAPATTMDNAQDVLSGVAALSGKAGAGFIANEIGGLARKFKSFGMGKKAAEGLAKGLFDPNDSKDVIAVLKRLGKDKDIATYIGSRLGTVTAGTAPLEGDGQ